MNRKGFLLLALVVAVFAIGFLMNWQPESPDEGPKLQGGAEQSEQAQ
jgi:hypothetical protein